MIPLTFAPDVVEEAVLLAERKMSVGDRRTFRRERDSIYEIRDDDVRDREFIELHARWFFRLGLNHPVDAVIRDVLGAAAGIQAGRVVRAVTRTEEGADLVDRAAGGSAVPLLVVRLRPATLLEPAQVSELLRHELMHVRDMLDPRFGYVRSLPGGDAAVTETLLRDRYRVLWDVTIDGRLARVGRARADAEMLRWREFQAAFPMLGDAARAAFDDWFHGERPTHEELIRFASAPAGAP